MPSGKYPTGSGMISGYTLLLAKAVTGKASNLAEQHQSLDFKKVDEGDAIYYLGQFGFTNGQVFRLSINVQPDPNKASFNIKFEQKFYED